MERYDFASLCSKPSSDSWSLGQVYMHLIKNTEYYVEQARLCATASDNISEEASPVAKAMFLNNDFPDELIEGPPENSVTPQPSSKEHLVCCLLVLKNKLNEIDGLITKSPFKGKTKHPGLNYFNADEWLQFADMHLRHHLRQKKRIDDFLKTKQDRGDISAFRQT